VCKTLTSERALESMSMEGWTVGDWASSLLSVSRLQIVEKMRQARPDKRYGTEKDLTSVGPPEKDQQGQSGKIHIST